MSIFSLNHKKILKPKFHNENVQKKTFLCKPTRAFFSDSFRGNWDWKWHLKIKCRDCKKMPVCCKVSEPEEAKVTSKVGFYYFEVIIRKFFASLLVVVGKRCEYENMDSVTRYTSLQKPRQRFHS